jgi:hypothetical protein
MDQIAVDKLSSGTPGENITVGPDKMTYQNAFNLADFEDDDHINKRAALQAFNFSLPISIPSGSDYPLSIDMTNPTYADILPGFIEQFEVLNDVFAAATSSFAVWDCKCIKNYTDDTRTALSSLTVYGHQDPANPAQTIDEMQMLMR